MKLPKYIDCKTNTTHCGYYVTKACRESCPYHFEIMGLGIGAADIGSVKGLQKLVVPGEGLNKLFEGKE